MVTGINHLTLATKDLEKSFSFYKDVLGFHPVLKHSRGAYLLAGDFWFCLDLDPATRTEPLPEYTHIAWTVELNNFIPISEKIKNSGAAIWKVNKSEGNSLYFLDPDGHKLEVHVGNLETRLQHSREKPWGENMAVYPPETGSFPFTIRRAESKEAKFLSGLALRSKAFWPYPYDYLIKCIDALALSEQDITEWPVYVAENRIEVVGFFALKLVSNEERLDHLFIDPRFIGKGVGRFLFLKSVQEAKNIGWQKFRIAADPYALDFYLKMGAVRVGEIQSLIKPDLFLPHLEFVL